MADTKISNLPAATALAETDLVPVVQSGVNAKATVNQLAPALIAYAEATLNPLGQSLEGKPDGVYGFRVFEGTITPVPLTDSAAPAPTPAPGQSMPPPPPSAPPPSSPASSTVRNNYGLQSQSITTSPWVNANNRLTIASRTSPPSPLTAWWTVTANASVSDHGLLQQLTEAPAGQMCVSFVADDVDDWCYAKLMSSTFSTLAVAYFNVDAGVKGSVSGTGFTHDITAHTGGGWVCSVTGTLPDDAWVEIGPVDVDGGSSVTSGKAFAFGGFQVEDGSVRTRYRPTTTAVGTRTLTTINDSIDDASLVAGETGTATFTLLDDQGNPWDNFSQLVPATDARAILTADATAPATSASGVTTATYTAVAAGTASVYGSVGLLRSAGESVTVTAAPAPAPSPTPAPSPVPPGTSEAQVFMSSSRSLATETPRFFSVSAWETPKNPNRIGPPAGSYSINRYCSYAPVNYFTELTHLASGAASYADFRTWVDYHKARNADVMVQVWTNNLGSSTTLTTGQWNTYKAHLNTLITQAAGDVKYFLLPNEPLFSGAPGDNPGEATSPGWPSRSATLYAELARVVKQVILQSAWPTIKVIGPEIMSLDSFRRSIGVYVMNSSAAGYDAGLGTGSGTKMKDFIDIFSFHSYHYTGGSFAPVDGGYSLIQSMKTELAAIGWTGPIWATEWMRTAGGSMFGDAWSVIVEQMARRHAAEVASGVGNSNLFEWGSAGTNSFFDDNTSRGQAARTWWAAYVNWWMAAPIGRIVRLTDNRLRVTRTDGATLTIPTNLTDGTLAPNP